jgi:hypothetical protein
MEGEETGKWTSKLLVREHARCDPTSIKQHYQQLGRNNVFGRFT